MDDLPELPFEKVLSYLGLRDRLMLSAVSRRCYQKIHNSRVKTVCLSARPSGFILGKNRWVSGTFAQNFICSTRFESFFDTFGQTILSSLKHLRLCDVDLTKRDRTAFIINSFVQLEQLGIIRAKCGHQRHLKLNLPMLTSIHLNKLIAKVTLEAPKLQEVELKQVPGLDRKLNIVHGESVERLIIEILEQVEVKKLTNLQYLYTSYSSCIESFDPTLLSSLKHLKEFHTNMPRDVSNLFEQKRRYERADLKIYLYGLLLNGPDDPAINAPLYSSGYLTRKWFACLAENPSRLADEIPFGNRTHYSYIERVARGLEVDVLKRGTDLNSIYVGRPVQNIQRFLDLLKNCDNIVDLWFDCDQPQELFDRLPEHSAVQKLTIARPPSDLAFLFRLKHLIHLYLSKSIDAETVRRAFDELPVLSSFWFKRVDDFVSIEITDSGQFRATFDSQWKTVSDLNAAIEFIFKNENEQSRSRKRKADNLESKPPAVKSTKFI